MKKQNWTLVVTATVTTGLYAMPVYADAISPQIRDKGKIYSKDKPDTSMYGTGVGGRAMEAMTLRFEVERHLQDGELDDAIAKAKKATQLDPSAPETHLLLARGMTRKFYTKEGPVDEKLLKECLYEWRLIWFHDSDQFDQVEAKNEARRLMKIARVLEKKHEQEEQARMAAREQLAKARAAEAAANAAAERGEELSATAGPDAQGGKVIAQKKKRFLF